MKTLTTTIKHKITDELLEVSPIRGIDKIEDVMEIIIELKTPDIKYHQICWIGSDDNKKMEEYLKP